MNEGVFASLLVARQKIESLFAKKDDFLPAGIFHPYQGKLLVETGGIYYVGQATRGEWCSDQEQTLENSSMWSLDFVSFEDLDFMEGTLLSAQGSPFWRFLNKLCISSFGEDMLAARPRWGWSNLLKVGAYNDGRPQLGPDRWRTGMKSLQQAACIASLDNELLAIRNSLIYIGSTSDFDIAKNVFGQDLWESTLEMDGLWIRVFDWKNGNVVCHGPHPGAVGFFGTKADDVAQRLGKIYKGIQKSKVALERGRT